MSANTTAPAARAGWRAWAGLAVLSLPTTLQALDITVLYLALPHLSTDLGASASERLWIIDVYGFMVAGFLVIMGTLGDRIGRRRLLILGSAAFGAASVMAAYSTTPEMLIAARVLLGVAGATLMPSTLALISTMFPDPRQRGLAFGVWATSFSAGIALGPILGGLLLEFFWWGSVFLLAVPVMVLLLTTAPFLLPEYRDPEPGRLDLPSALLSLAAVLPVVFGLKQLAKHGPEPVALAAIAAGAVLGVLFVRRQRRLADPLMDLRLFAGAAFSSALAVMLMGLLLVGGIYLFVTQYLQSVAGLSPLVAGLWLLPSAAGLVVASTLAPVIARRVPPARVLAGSLTLAALGFLLLTRVGPEDGLLTVVAGFTLVYVGTSPIMALGTDLIVGSAPPEKAGASAAISETAMEVGVALGIAVFGSVGTAVYRLSMTDAIPGGVSAADAAEAADGLEGAGRAAADLPAPVARDLLDAAAASFTSSFTTVAWISAALAVGIAVLAAAALRRVPPTGTAADGGDTSPEVGETVAG
ncbi:Multidrug efflux pump LfrA [Nocardiopsis dassonvillei]|uniref:MFS transporter n=1 Tax=Nocardiopsis dassonvillei TaxID=2014 RepID=UPI003F57583E